MEIALLTMGIVAVVGAVFYFAARQTRKAREGWAAIAREHDLRFRPGGWLKGMEMTGDIGGIPVKVHTISRSAGNHSQLYTVVEARPTAPLPAGLRLHKEGLGTKIVKAFGGQDIPLEDALFDAKLRVRGDDPAAVKAVLDQPAAEAGMQAVVGGKAYTRFEDGALILEQHGYALGELDAMVRTAVAGAQGLDIAVREPWARIARDRGLRHEETATSATLDGVLRDLAVLVRVRHSGERARTDIAIALEGGLPSGVRIRAGEGSPRLGDPILDGRVIVESTGRDPRPRDAAIAWMKVRLQDPRQDLRGCLMDVLQGLPGARIEDGRLLYTLERRPGPELAEMLDRLIALGAALSEPGAPPTADPEQEARRRRQAAAARGRS
jgi:hypothetical protein